MEKKYNNKIPAIVIGVNIDKKEYQTYCESLEELSLLADTAGYYPVVKLLQKCNHIDPAYYIGPTKASEIKQITTESKAEAVLFDFELSPVQLRNLEQLIKKRIISRTELILNIFEKRARTKEAKLQVELATLLYSLPRLRHMWTHLHRMEGGIGTRGPGEKQIEIDRRRAMKKINKIKKELVSVKTHRDVQRKNRRYKNKVALVGYTNAGKSSLLNRLAHSTLFTENRLFATLDPATREVWLGDGQKALITDTVGFIKRLPHTLIASFRSTLEEVNDADLLLHVVDISTHDVLDRIQAVNDVLREISAHNLPVFYVFNKIDLLSDRETKVSILSRFEKRAVVSARTGEGIDQLKKCILSYFNSLKAKEPLRAG